MESKNDDNEDHQHIVENEKKAPKRKLVEVNGDKSDEKPQQKRYAGWIDKFKRRSRALNYKECKNDLNHFFYVHIRSQMYVRHPFLPNFNVGLNPVEDETDLPQNIYPHCTIVEPRPIYLSEKHCDSVDVCYKRTIADNFFKKRGVTARTKYQNLYKTSRQLRKRGNKNTYPSMVFTLAERLERFWDPYFYGNYDFYYTGGNLCTLQETDTHNVLHVDNVTPNALKLSTYPLQYADSAILEEHTSVNLPSKDQIFEVVSLKAMNGAQDLVAVRQMNKVTLIRIDTDRNKMKLLVEVQANKAPFISMAQSLENPELLVVTTMRQNLRIYDINEPRNIALTYFHKLQPPGVVSCWNRIQRWYDKTFLYANQHQLMFADLRAPQSDWLKNECTFSSKEYICEFNTSLAPSEFDHLFYVGTTHKLCCLDERFMKQRTNYEQTTVCQWTHQLDYPPAYLEVYRQGVHEYVAFASQVAGDMRVCQLTQSKQFENTEEGCNFESFCLPWQPPTILEAYDSASVAGKLLQIHSGLKQRIRACTTGLGFLKAENTSKMEAVLMYSNSIGDVYAQAMKEREKYVAEERLTASSDDMMSEFADNLCKFEPPPLNYTDTADMNALRSVFCCRQLNEKPTQGEDEAENEKLPANAADSILKKTKGAWRKTISTLSSYKDALVPDLLAIWDIPAESGIDVEYSTLQKEFNIENSENNITSWLNKNDKIAPKTKTPHNTTLISNSNISSMDMNSFGNEMQAQSTQIYTQSTDISWMNTSNLLDNTETLLRTTAKSKNPKNKKKHVKGF